MGPMVSAEFPNKMTNGNRLNFNYYIEFHRTSLIPEFMLISSKL